MFYFKGTRKPDFSRIERIDYDKYWQTRGFQLRAKLMEREKIFFNWIKPRCKALDIGCGNSRLLLELQARKDCKVLGLDASRFAVEGQKEAGVDAVTADIESQHFALEGAYDYVILSEVLEHIRDPEELMAKFINHAEYIVLSVPNSAFYRYRIGLMFSGRFFTQWAQHPSEHLRYWSHIDFLDWLEAMNLTVVKYQASNGFWLKNLWPNMFGHQICYLVKFRL